MRRALNVAGGVALGLALSQFPEFSQQYAQRLGGAVDELHAIVTEFDAAAAREGLSRDEALVRYEDNADTFIAGRGTDMGITIARYERLSSHLSVLESAGPLGRLTGLAQYYDPQIGARAFEAYKPGVPVTTEGFVYAGVGILAGYGIVALLTAPLRRRRNRRV